MSRRDTDGTQMGHRRDTDGTQMGHRVQNGAHAVTNFGLLVVSSFRQKP